MKKFVAITLILVAIANVLYGCIKGPSATDIKADRVETKNVDAQRAELKD